MKLALLEVRQGKIATVRGSIRIDKGPGTPRRSTPCEMSQSVP
jgi:hypothetical protein